MELSNHVVYSSNDPLDVFQQILSRQSSGWLLHNYWRRRYWWTTVYYVEFRKAAPPDVVLRAVMGPASKREIAMAAFVLTDAQKVSMTLEFEDDAGNAVPADQASINGTPSWSSSDDTVLTVTPAADGLSAEVVTTGKVAPAQVNVKANATINGNAQDLTLVQDFDVTLGAATKIGAKMGVPESRI